MLPVPYGHRGVIRRPRQYGERGRAAVVGAGAVASYAVGRYLSGGKRSRSASATASKIYSASKKAKSVAKQLKKIQRKKKPINKLEKRLREVEKCCKASTATLISRDTLVGLQSSNANQSNHTTYSANNKNLIDSFLTNVRVYNSETGAYDTKDYSVITRDVNMHMKSYSKITIRNNQTTPMEVDIYCMVAKADTGSSPNAFFTSGLADIGNPSSTAPNIYISDSPHVSANWKTVKHKRKVLDSGKELRLSHSESFTFNPSLADSQQDVYQKRYGAYVYVVRIMGSLGHEAALVGLTSAKADFMLERKYTMEYDGGQDFTTLVVNDDMDTPTVDHKTGLPRQAEVLVPTY